MTNDEICKYEYDRSEKNLNKIYLFKNNGGFWRANEWSCYLLYFCNKELEENQRLKLSHKTAKAGMDKSIISCGLKENSFQKFITNSIELEIKSNNENIKAFEINLLNYSAEINIDNFINILKEFKQSVQINNTSTNSSNNLISNNKNPFNNPITFTSIIKKIITYSLYNKTSDDMAEFIQELKEDSCSLF